MADKIYADGLYGKKPSEKAPDFVVGSLSVKLEQFILFLHAHVNPKGYVNLQILKGKEERLNIVLDTYQPKEKTEDVPVQSPPVQTKPKEQMPSSDDLPF